MSGVAVALFFDRVDGQERVAGNPGVGGSSAAAASRTCHGGQVDRFDGSTRSIGPCYVTSSTPKLRMKILNHFGLGDIGTWCHHLLGDVGVELGSPRSRCACTSGHT